tara:strand:- start:44 stop:820 length:777 start_codon:yes stop_codon:yes gene_type:complete
LRTFGDSFKTGKDLMMLPTSFATAAAYLDYGRDPDRRPLPGRWTRLLRRPDGSIAVCYHSTDVVTYHPDGRTVLDSGGWRTYTTKDRINAYTSGAHYLHQLDGIWYLGDGWPSAFEDGITIHPDGSRTWPAPIAGALNRTQLDDRIVAYARAFGRAVDAGTIGLPDGGDCWGCLFGTDADPDLHPLGTDHLLEHFGGTVDQPDPYFVPSLLFRAFGQHGSPAYCLQTCLDRRDGRWASLTLRRYLRRMLLTPAVTVAH